MIQVGSARLTVISVGDLRCDLAEWLKLSPTDAAAFPTPLAVPVQSFHIALPGMTALVDAGGYSPSDKSFLLEDYTPPPPLLEGMRARGLPPEEVEHVILTHAHFDHFLGVTRDGAPSFPRARYYLGAADLEVARKRPEFAHTFGVLLEAGVLELVSEERDLGHGLTILPCPGETPGHQIVRLHSQGETAYCLGDLYHHEVEFEHPEWRVWWADEATNRSSRAMLGARARAENALLLPTHISPPGRLGEDGRLVQRQ